MAGIAIPENLRPFVATVAKYHFWILAAIAPLVLVPTLFLGTSGLRTRITAARRQIDSKLGQARAVTALQPHPNEAWRTAIENDAASVDREMRDEWRRFWHSQASLRTWPAELGKEFLDDVAALQPGGKLQIASLNRYQNMAPRLVRALPQLMGVEDTMAAAAASDGRPVAAGQPGGAGGLTPKLTWNPATQRRIHDSFVWDRRPNTTQVLVAQEELWVYGLFCRLLAGFVKDATGGHDSPLTSVDELAVGFPAIVNPDRGQQASRVLIPKTAGAPDGTPGMDAAPGADGPAQAPWNPRYAAAGGSRPSVGGQPAGPTEDDYRGFLYVDLDGKPLSAADLAAKPGMQMVHLMPFVLRATMDQRKLDALLLSLASAPVPIDVRQVRVNPGTTTGAASLRQNDVIVEFQGTVALATNPAAATPPKPAEAGATP